eukprot:CAMPEP_0170608242 /NCGR_PEP_ID=MMETSP0224-20130122/21482_1 /TAXON_ID=285029 /ORGANISM="Togula jolla, Strain CCCM 725" /LENGTH=171 /DNA_ID=CAMNT_0010933459 /DNA_START=108 /DNA_END=623 /DNA_ORIENTATION=+
MPEQMSQPQPGVDLGTERTQDFATEKMQESEGASRAAEQKSEPEKQTQKGPAPAGQAPPVPEKAPLSSSEGAASELEEGAQFIVEVEKTAAQNKIGLEVDKHSGPTVLIVTVKPGLIQDYNRRVAEGGGGHEVKPGYHIVNVNGVSENPAKMVEEVGRSNALKLTFVVGKP